MSVPPHSILLPLWWWWQLQWGLGLDDLKIGQQHVCSFRWVGGSREQNDKETFCLIRMVGGWGTEEQINILSDQFKWNSRQHLQLVMAAPRGMCRQSTMVAILILAQKEMKNALSSSVMWKQGLLPMHLCSCITAFFAFLMQPCFLAFFQHFYCVLTSVQHSMLFLEWNGVLWITTKHIPFNNPNCWSDII